MSPEWYDDDIYAEPITPCIKREDMPIEEIVKEIIEDVYNKIIKNNGKIPNEKFAGEYLNSLIEVYALNNHCRKVDLSDAIYDGYEGCRELVNDLYQTLINEGKSSYVITLWNETHIEIDEDISQQLYQIFLDKENVDRNDIIMANQIYQASEDSPNLSDEKIQGIYEKFFDKEDFESAKAFYEIINVSPQLSDEDIQRIYEKFFDNEDFESVKAFYEMINVSPQLSNEKIQGIYGKLIKENVRDAKEFNELVGKDPDWNELNDAVQNAYLRILPDLENKELKILEEWSETPPSDKTIKDVYKRLFSEGNNKAIEDVFNKYKVNPNLSELFE